MPTSTDDLLKATEAARALLDQLHLSACAFEVEPREGGWEVRVECAVAEGWQRSVLSADKVLLLASAQDPTARGRLLADWGKHLATCKRGKNQPTGVDP
jgi:hypothetical protein